MTKDSHHDRSWKREREPKKSGIFLVEPDSVYLLKFGSSSLIPFIMRTHTRRMSLSYCASWIISWKVSLNFAIFAGGKNNSKPFPFSDTEIEIETQTKTKFETESCISLH